VAGGSETAPPGHGGPAKQSRTSLRQAIEHHQHQQQQQRRDDTLPETITTTTTEEHRPPWLLPTPQTGNEMSTAPSVDDDREASGNEASDDETD